MSSAGVAARGLRVLVRWLVLFPLLWAHAGRVRVHVTAPLPPGPLLVVANHASHADTVAVLRALPRRVRARLAPAAARDYFFTGRLRGLLTAGMLGAFPFDRIGPDGLDAAAARLQAGRCVLLFPEGSRAGGAFRAGAGRLVAEGAVVVPVGLAGTGALLPRGSARPRRARVAVTVGTARRYDPAADPAAVAADLEAEVARLSADAERRRAPAPTSWLLRARALAASPRGLAVILIWSLAEALVVPIVPDLGIGLLAAAAPGRLLALAAAGTLGSVLGGLGGYIAGAGGFVPRMLLVTAPMADTARTALADAGAQGVWVQPLSGVPFKAFAYQAAGAGVDAPAFAAVTALARGGRMLAVALAFAGLGAVLRRWCPPCRAPAVYTVGVALLLAFFAIGLVGVVAAQSAPGLLQAATSP